MRLDKRRAIRQRHLRILRDSLLTRVRSNGGWESDPESCKRKGCSDDASVSLDGVVRGKDVRHSLTPDGEEGDTDFGRGNRDQSTISTAIRDLQVVLSGEDCYTTTGSDDNPRTTGTGASGWQLVVLLGEMEKSLRSALWRDNTATGTRGERMLTKLWRRTGVRAVVRIHNLSGPSTEGKLPGAVFDRLLEALLWRLPRPPGPGIRGGTIRAALRKQLGSRPAMREGEATIRDVVADWKRCCELAQAWRQKRGSFRTTVEDEPDEEKNEGDRGVAERRRWVCDTAHTNGDRTEGKRQNAVLQPSNEGIRGASDPGVFQALRTIRRRMQVGRTVLDWDNTWSVLNSLLSRSAYQILRTRTEWRRTRSSLF